MLGVVFSEYMEFVEQRFGLDVADAMLSRSELSTDGAYTAFGTYPAAEMVRLVGELAAQTDTEVADLLRAYGQHLFGRFTELHPEMFTGRSDAFEFLSLVERHIHVEVQRLYPTAELPRFEHDKHQDGITMVYRSPRGLGAFAEGLIVGCCEHFDEGVAIETTDLSGGAGTVVRFEVRRVEAP